jgi:hypothetical protein
VAVDLDNNIGSKQISVTYLPTSVNPAVPLSAKLVSAKQKGKGVQVSLACSGPAGSTCKGKGVLSSTEKRSLGPITGVSSARKKKGKPHTVSVGSKGYSIAAGKTGTFTVPLNKEGKSLLTRFAKVPTTLVIRLTEPDGTTLEAAKKKLSLKGKKKKKK